MSNYITRVELHGATYEDYEKLHAAMASAGFTRKVRADDGTIYQLPTAEYFVDSSLDVAAIRDAARAAANTTGRSSWVLAVKSDAMAWYLAA